MDEIAVMWNKTKDPKYKDQWYKLVKELANGFNNTERRIVSISAINKADDGTYVVIGKRDRSVWSVWYCKTETDNVSWLSYQRSCNERW